MMELFIKGGPVMYPLLICSLITLTIIIERTIFWINLTIHYNQKLVDEMLELCRLGEWSKIRQRIKGTENYIIRILACGILHRNYSMVKAMESSAVDEINIMKHSMEVLNTIITVAPLLGIFGTVIGIIISFDMLGSGIEEPKAVTEGIAQALITTASGLGIAILTVFPYNYFNAKIEKAIQNIEKYSTNLEIVYEKVIMKSDNKGIKNENQNACFKKAENRNTASY